MHALPDGLAPRAPLRLPRWATLPLERDEDATAAHAGAALAVLDAAAAAAAPHAGAWTERLGLTAAVIAVGRLGRSEDEAALRDGIALSPDPPAGPAAPVLRAYLWLASGRTGDRWTDLPGLLAGLGARTGSTSTDLAAALAAAAAMACPLAAASAAIRAVAVVRPGRGALALWAVDVALARWLGWPYGLPLLTLGLPHGVPDPGALAAADTERRLATAVLRGSARALDRFAVLGRSAATLQELRPRLRARPAGRVVDRLLSRDALSVAGVRDLIPERAARRLFDRLVALGAIRELTGRATARLYGL